MAKTAFKSVGEYLAKQPEPARGVLEQVRAVIKKALPGATEVISYQIPAYRLNGRIVLYFAGWAQHYSIYPVGDALIAAFGDELASYELSHKGTIRFAFSKRVPTALIARIAKYRAKEVAERKPSTKGAKKKAPKKKAPKKRRLTSRARASKLRRVTSK